MELFNSTAVSIPFMQILLLLIFSTLMLLFGRVKLALLTNYLFTFYWGFGVNLEKLAGISNDILPLFGFSYLGFGLLVVALISIGFHYTTK
jgi:hypothetical protein